MEQRAAKRWVLDFYASVIELSEADGLYLPDQSNDECFPPGDIERIDKARHELADELLRRSKGRDDER